MSDLVDSLLLRYLDPANVDTLLVPAADTGRLRVRALLAQVFEPRLVTVQTVGQVSVVKKAFQVPLVEPSVVQGTWEKLTPASERAVASVEIPAIAQTNWVDMVLDTTVAVEVSSLDSRLDEIASADVSELSEADFVAKFAFLDLPDLMRAAGVSTYQELQADFPRLYRLHYADPPPYQPGDPAAQRIYKLRVCALFFGGALDLSGALRRMIQARRALDAIHPRPEGYEGGDVLSAGAWLAVFPAAAVTPPNTQEKVAALFAAEGLAAAFEAA
ncbi:MAG: hypothetical protein HOV83_40500 [Catenulispora sp.]|nr:hypothetical protein [Catenulispora sp.]